MSTADKVGFVGRSRRFFERHWLPSLIVIAVALELVGFLRIYFLLGWPRILADSALFQHGGWYVTVGGVPYVDFWDIKPPLVYFTTAALALVSGGDMYVLHLLSSFVGAASIVCAVVLVGLLADELVADRFAAFVAGFTMLVLTPLYLSPMLGIRAKYFHVTFGLLAIHLSVQDRPFPAGVAGAVAAAYYPTAGVYLLLGLGLSVQRGGRRALVRGLGGVASVGLLVLLPFVIWGAVTPLIVETVLALFVTSTSSTVVGHLGELVVALGPGVLALGVAAGGWYRGWQHARARTWWVVGGGIAFAAKVVLVDLESWADLIGLMPFVALGVGVFAATLPRRGRLALGAATCVIVAVGVLWTFFLADPVAAVLPSYDVSTAVSHGGNAPDVKTIYWERLTPETCHYRLSLRETQWIEATGAGYDDARCGRWPFDRG